MVTEDQEITNLTGINSLHRRDLMLYFANLPEEIQMQITKDLFKIANKNESRMKPGLESVFLFSHLLLLVQNLERLESANTRKGKLTKKELEQVAAIRLKRFKATPKIKPQKKKDIIEKQFYDLIIQLRKEDLSWRDISEYIATYHKKRFSFSYLEKTFNQLKNNTNNIDK